MNGLVVTFGEVMGRISPPGARRFLQAMPGTVEFSFGGAEANVAVTLARLGARAALVTALPDNPIADVCVAHLRGLGVETDRILRRSEGRLGLYYAEPGANQRPSVVVYDRECSTLALTESSAYDWDRCLDGADWFHTTGITPALSAEAAGAVRAAMSAARRRGATVSCDLNFRRKLWRWQPGTPARELASRIMRELLPMVDVLIANEEDAAEVLGIRAADTDVDAGRLAVDRYPEVAARIVTEFPNIRWVAVTLRESVSADYNRWGGLLYDGATGHVELAPLRNGSYEPYEIRDIVDRIGAGDAFAAGLIFGMRTPELAQPHRALAFAVALSCLAHSVHGDFALITRAEVEALMKGSGTGRVQR